MFQRLFIRKKPDFRLSPVDIKSLKEQLNLPKLQGIETIAVYDLHHCPENLIEKAIARVFKDPVSDEALESLPKSDRQFVIEPLPGQFDQRADSAEQCLKLLDPAFENTIVRSALAYLIQGELQEEELERLKNYFLNPIETREKDLTQTTLSAITPPEPIPYFTNFIKLNDDALKDFHKEQSLAMTFADLKLIQNYFQKESRAPSETELRVLDTYWSDHCRHTTFATELENIHFPKSALGEAMAEDFQSFLKKRREIYQEKAEERPVTLMEIATIDSKYLRHKGELQDVEFSEEINACSVFIQVKEQNETRPWLLQFKNETHNHPTEIEPFGGASTCLGGAIRDPLSGRAYVYQAMRLSGSADPRQNISETLNGKLPQRLIAQRAAEGYSSYGNQIGLATGQVVEVYHPGYIAKHLEVGAVVAATPAEHVRREKPQEGDFILLLGGATGRDGCGGATGSSKEQHQNSLEQSAAEVQKGNAPEERKLQRLFRKKEFAQKIKRCNDFGAGGVSVAIGELADSLEIDLDKIPTKYQGLTGTELAISESQERMAVVVAKEDAETIIALAGEENLNATIIAEVKDHKRLIMRWQGQEIVNLSREFLDSNGAKTTQTDIELLDAPKNNTKNTNKAWHERLKAQLQALNHSDLRGLGDRFDFHVGASCILKPYGGRYNATPSEASVYALPTETPCETASILAYGFNPEQSAAHPYLGAINAVAEASARIIACGGRIENTHFSLQEYFPKLGKDSKRWGLPLAALLGAHHALSALNRAAIGGKDSMSGSFNDLDVPPTLIAFAVATIEHKNTFSPEFKEENHEIYYLSGKKDALGRVDFQALLANQALINELRPHIQSIRSIRHGGLMQALYESCLGNRIGVKIHNLPEDPFESDYGGFLISSKSALPKHPNLLHIGTSSNAPQISHQGHSLSLDELAKLQNTLEDIYPLYHQNKEPPLTPLPKAQNINKRPIKARHNKIRISLPVFPGTNSELDTARAFRLEGGEVKETVLLNRSQQDIENALKHLQKNIQQSQIFVLSGGFSAGDEPDGSGKFIANILFNPIIADALQELLQRDGLILGICNGFQALIKTGLLPHGKIQTPTADDPTLTHNLLQRHIARIAQTKIINNHSPWLNQFNIDDIHDVAFSHGEGRFYASDAMIQQLAKNGQIACQYVDIKGQASMDPAYNPNGSRYAIEAITSPCGRILGKMGHSERYREGLYRNHPDFRPQNIFRAGIKAFQS